MVVPAFVMLLLLVGSVGEATSSTLLPSAAVRFRAITVFAVPLVLGQRRDSASPSPKGTAPPLSRSPQHAP